MKKNTIKLLIQKKWFIQLHDKFQKLLLSNSDPKNTNPDDDFFEEAYRDFDIRRVLATRAINSKASKRGKIMVIQKN